MRGENKIDSRPEVTVLLITIDSTCPKPIENLIFNAKVEKPYRNGYKQSLILDGSKLALAKQEKWHKSL